MKYVNENRIMDKLFEVSELKYYIDFGSTGGIFIKIAYLTFVTSTFQIKCYIIKLTDIVDCCWFHEKITIPYILLHEAQLFFSHWQNIVRNNPDQKQHWKTWCTM